MWVGPLGWGNPLEKGKATYSSVLAWRIPWIEEPGGLRSTGLQRVGHDWATWHTHQKLKLCLLLLLSRFIHIRICATPWTAAYQAPLSMDFPDKSAGVGCHCLLRNYVLRGSNQGVSSAVFPEAPGETLFLCLFHLLETPRPLTAFRLQSRQEHHSASASVITPPPLTLFPVSLFHI